MSSRRRMLLSAGFKVEQIKNLPIGSKIKFSSGKTFVLQIKNASGHSANTVTLVSEYIIENQRWSGGADSYSESYIHTSIMPKYYNELSALEKSKFVKYDNYQHFWIPSEYDVKNNRLGFTNNASRIKKHINGKQGEWWIADHWMREGMYSGEPMLKPDGSTETKYTAPYYGYANYIGKSGGIGEVRVGSGSIWYTKHTLPNGNSYDTRKTYTCGPTGAESGVVPFCDINGDTWVKLEKGYWIFVDK